jgi:hypothetical protein
MSDAGGCPTPRGRFHSPVGGLERAAAIRDAGVCGPLSRTSALAPRKPPHGPLVRWVAGASLRRGDPGHDGVDVHAAPAPGGLSTAAATGGTTHVVLLWLALNYWLTVKCNRPRWVCPGTWARVLPASTRPTSSRWRFPLKTGFLLVCSRLRYESHGCPYSPEERRTGSRPWPSALRLAGSSGFG